MKLFCQLFLCFAWCIASPVWSVEHAPPVQLDAATAFVDLGGHLDIHRDPTRALTIDQAAASDFQPLNQAFSLGFTQDAVWLRITVDRRADATDEWWLEIQQPMMEDIRLYEQSADGAFRERRGGEIYPHRTREVNHRNAIFKLQWDQPGVQTFYLRLASNKAMTARFKLWQPTAFFDTLMRDTILNSMFFGVNAVILLIYAAFWLQTRQKSSLYYLAYVSLLVLIYGVTMGYVQSYLYPLHGDVTAKLFGGSVCLAVSVGASFASLLYDLRRLMPRFNRIYLAILWGVPLFCLALIVLGYYPLAMPIIETVSMVNSVVITTVPLYLGFRGHRHVWFYLLTFTILEAAVTVRFMNNLGFFPGAVWAETAMQTGTLIHLALMSCALIWEYRRVSKERDRAEADKQRMEVSLVQERQTNQQQKDFLGMVSHEFRTPLSIIEASAHMLQHHSHDETERSQRYSKIERATDRLRSLLDNYLSRERLETIESKPQLREHDVIALAKGTISEVLATSGPSVDLICDHPPATACCDPDLLRILLRNLLENARRHSLPQQTVSLTLTGLEDNGVRITVRDLGAGIPPDELPHVFDRFFRGRGSQGKVGAGLGLYLVRQIAAQHGGSVTVDSTLGVGSCFTVTLPSLASTTRDSSA